MLRPSLLFIPALLLCLGLFGQSGHAQPDPFASTKDTFAGPAEEEFLPVEQAYQLSVNADATGWVLRWEIQPGYYLYRHGFKLSVDGVDLLASVSIPDGVAKTDEFFGDVQVYYDSVTLELAAGSGQILEVQSQGCADAGLCYPPYRQQFMLEAGAASEIDGTPSGSRSALPASSETEMTLLLAALFAFMGGLILNLMPCVLPVLSLKVIGLANSHDNVRQRTAHGWWYTAGVVGSFCLVAAILIALKTAGSAIGWGFQLQNPWFVASLVYLFFIISLLLIGAADFSGQWMGFGQSLASGGGYRGSFFTGVLAVLVASPCTAPFMGTAMGFATAQPAPAALAVFAALGLGMAFPFLLLSYIPSLGRWLPKPGAWMERFKEFLAFPLLATAIWLLWVIGGQTGADGVALVLGGCLLITIALWIKAAHLPARLARYALLAGALALLAGPWLKPADTTMSADNAYSQARVEQLLADKQAVFVNFTADWCITCLANERLVLATDEVKQAFAERDIAYLKADWSRYNPAISHALEQFGRSGIPLYLYYPAGSAGAPIILPQILTRELVLETLAQESGGKVAPNKQD